MWDMPETVTAPPAGEATPEGPGGPLAIDGTCQDAFWRGRRLDLSPTEYAVLACLHRQAGQTVTYDGLLQEVWGTSLDEGGSLWQVRSTVKRLRQKLAAVADDSCHLVNVRNIGYRLDLPSARQCAQPAHPHRSIALRVGLVLIVVAILTTVAAGWLLVRQGRGDPTTLVWYRQRQVPVGLLWALHRGQHCCQGPDGALYCFDTPEERAAAVDVLMRNAAPQGQDRTREPGVTPVPQPQSE
jgi:DNA-binding winged helix-turn-helix (wHTH) protein